MRRLFSSHPGAVTLAAAFLSLGWAASPAAAGGPGYRGGYRGGYYGYRGGYYGRGYYPYHGWGYYGYRPYVGIGIGIYVPYYDYVPPPVVVAPAPVVVQSPVVATPGAAPAPATAEQQQQPPPDDAAHLQLLVPEGSEVWINGTRTTRAGTTREFVSPPLVPGKVYTFRITVRHPDASGKLVDDRRDFRIRANDWFSIDFTRPAPPERPAPAPAPVPAP